ncbi:MAG: helicase-associated domain-containing protein [Treponema sp.]|nr:helicase-associated domain-containing protein [Treponema sp.]
MDQKILMKKWQDYVAALSDKDFSSLMHLYLGDFKTPYNKQRLIEQLASFLREKSNLSNMLLLLDEDDLAVLSAVRYLPLPSRQRLVRFFKNHRSIVQPAELLDNLVSRQWIFPEASPFTRSPDEENYRLNPLLLNEVEARLSPARLFDAGEKCRSNLDDSFVLSPSFMAALLCFVKIHGISCKNDGAIRKSDLNALEEIFPGRTECIRLLVQGLVSLKVLYDDGKCICVDDKRLFEFARLNPEKQYTFLAVASRLGSSRSTLQKNSVLLQNLLASIPETGLSKNDILRLSFFINSESENSGNVRGGAAGGGRFARMMEVHARTTFEGETESEGKDFSGDFMEVVFDAVLAFGLVHCIGFNENDEEIYVKTDLGNTLSLEGNPKVLNMSASSMVTLMPGLSLFNLLPLTDFLSPVNCSIVSEFEITKTSVSKAFDKGYDPQKILDTLLEHTAYELPQSLSANLDDWYNAYSAVSLFKGYVLRVKDENLAEKNPKVSAHIVEKIAPGVYLLDVAPEDTEGDFIRETGLNLLSKVRTAPERKESMPFPVLREPAGITLDFYKDDEADESSENVSLENAFYISMSEKIKGKGLPEIQTLVLLDKLRHKLIVNESQLSSNMIHMEVLQARGTDYQGKLHLLDSSSKKSDALVEVMVPDENDNLLQKKYIGRVQDLFTNEKGLQIHFYVEKTGTTQVFSVSQISQVTTLCSR